VFVRIDLLELTPLVRAKLIVMEISVVVVDMESIALPSYFFI
jgi:ABC-type antimicrobial peptide transport system ATPase subunit